MSKYIGFHVWYQVFDEFSEDQQHKIVSYIKDICSLVEKDINNRGGIAGLDIKICLDIVEPRNANKKHFLDFLKKNKDIHFLNNLPNYDHIDINDFSFEDYIHFDGLNSNPAIGNWNVYEIPSKLNINSLEFFRKSFKDKNLIVIVNDGYLNPDNCNDKAIKHLDHRILQGL